jgi:Amt family ammonium transporter
MITPTDAKWMEILMDDASPSGETWQTVKPEVETDLTAQETNLQTRWKSNPFPASSTTFQTFGVLILWFGWYGFNCVSTLAISAELSGVAAKVAVTTTCGAAGGALSAFAIVYILDGFQDLGAISNGILAGLVSITAACSVIEPWAAFLIGVIGGAVYVGACKLLEKLRIDDVVLAIPVHCFCGMWGVISCGLFATKDFLIDAYTVQDPQVDYGAFYGGGGKQLGIQLVGVIAIAAWTCGLSAIMFGCLKVRSHTSSHSLAVPASRDACAAP